MVATPAPVPVLDERKAHLHKTVEDKLEQLAADLANGFSENYLSVMAFWARFHSYSFANTILIFSQRPDAERVAGYNKWRELGRQVKQGATAIRIWCPIFRKVEDEDTGLLERKLVGFNPCPVFCDQDLEDIDTNPLPSLWTPLPDDMEELFQQLKTNIERTGIVISEGRLPRGAQGASNIYDGHITLKRGLDSRSRILTLIHECLHSVAHGINTPETTDQQREFEAESTAMVVAAIYGIDSPTASDYLLNWGTTVEHLKVSLPRIQSLVAGLMAILDPKEVAP